MGADAHAWRRHLLVGLAQCIGAQVALYLRLHDVGRENERIEAPLDEGFLEPARRALWSRYQREQAYRDVPFHLTYYEGFTSPIRTRRLYSVIDARMWRKSRHYNDFVRACGLDDRITSSLRLQKGQRSPIQTLVLHRNEADRPFSLRDQRVVHLTHHQLRPLLGRRLAMPEPADAMPDGLPLRLRQVLEGVLRGESEKEIAARLEISRHTVNRHVQRLYQRFEVGSRGELTFRCREMFPQIDTPR